MEQLSRFEVHSHTARGSNLRLIDSINTVEGLVERSLNLGLKGICITDHESLSATYQANDYVEKIQKEHSDFKIGLGNEIYLCSNRDKGQRYFHFILIAKNILGYKALKILSSRAWLNSYADRGMTRVVTTYEDLKEIVNKFPNCLIATTACLGSELSTTVSELIKVEKAGAPEVNYYHDRIVNFILFCQELFGDDFYIECAPGCSKEQIEVNQRLVSIAKCFNIKMVVGCDSHFLTKEDRYVHKAYLNSKQGDREVDSFYEYAYLQSNEEIIEHLKESGYSENFIKEMFLNSLEIYDKIENYSLKHKQQIPNVHIKDYPRKKRKGFSNYPNIDRMFDSEDKYDRYWVNECVNKLEELNLIQKKEYLDELEEEADVKRIVGERLHTNMFRYPILLQHYIDMIWECGSPIGAGRGSACAALNHYLLGITQLDPLEWSFPFFRYMNRDTLELGDIDIDVAPSKRPTVLKRIKQERRFMFNDDIDYLSKQDLGCVLVATFGTESTRSVILSSCRGYRSEEFPDGIDVDTAQYLSSLIPSERGFIRSLADTVYGNKEKDWKPIKSFVNEVQKYDGLLDIMFALEGLTKSRGSHASGVILFDGDPYDYCAFMRSPKGDVTTQFDLHECEAMGMTKLDILVTDAEEKIAQTLTLLQKDGIIEKDLSLRELYNKYLHPAVLPIDDKDTWKAIQEVSVLSLFQLDSDIGRQGTKKIKPKNMIELSSTNGLIRLMQPDGWDETPMDKYIKFRNNTSLWEKEMDNYHLTEKEKEAVRRYLTDTFGIGISQEQLMKVLIDKDICGYTLAEANAARRVISKKKMNKIPELKEQIWSKATSENLAKYIWNYVAAPGLG